MPNHILVIEDEPTLSRLLTYNLSQEGYQVETAAHGGEGLQMALRREFDLIILDIMLPGMNGFEVLTQLRKQGSVTPVIILTARTAEDEVVQGLRIGADDYITKPFSPRELVARIRAMLRRPRVLQSAATTTEQVGAPPRRFGALSINVAAREVDIGDEQILLTRTEFDILEALSDRKGVVLSRRQLLEIVREGPWVGNEHLVDVHIGHLRRKLGDDAANPRYITTVRGIGYRMGTGQ